MFAETPSLGYKHSPARGQRAGQDENLISGFPSYTQIWTDCLCGSFFQHMKKKIFIRTDSSPSLQIKKHNQTIRIFYDEI